MNELQVPTRTGTIIAEKMPTDDYQGIYLMLEHPTLDSRINLGCLACEPGTNELCLHLWRDASSTEISDTITFEHIPDDYKITEIPFMQLDENSPVVYICAPYRGATVTEQEQNVERAKEYGRFAVTQGCVPYIAHLAICGFLNDDIRSERKIGMQADAIMLRNSCSELWVFGSSISAGMQTEIKIAKACKKPIRYFTEGCVEYQPPKN